MNSFRFIVMGDRSSNNENEFRMVFEKIKNLPVQPQFILFVGDLIFGQNISSELRAWKDIVNDYYPIPQVFPAFGNHDRDESIFSQMFPHLPNEQLPGFQRTVYYFDVDNTRFIVLNSNRKDSKGRYIIDSRQRNWLEGLLKNNEKTHTFVMFHVPAYPIGHHYGESLDANPEERDALMSILDKYNVTATIVGHEHNYNRRLIDHSFSSNNRTFENFIYQLTIGVSGASKSMSVTDSRNVVVGPAGEQHYLIVDIIEDWSIFTVNDINNNQLDFVVHRSPIKPDHLQETLIPHGAIWKYLDDGSNQGTDWRKVSFNDSAWFSGPSKLGYGDGNESTIVSYGPDPANKPITTYFRKRFAIVDPSVYQDIIFKLLKDDGAVVYLNGTEVLRSNMPAGATEYKTLASSCLHDYSELILNESIISPSVLTPGINILAVEIHQVSPSSSDISFSLELIANKKPPKIQALIPLKSNWKYIDDGSDQGTAWRFLSFNDVSWKAGPAKLGYGNGDEATVLNYGPNPSQKQITSYFRKSLIVNDPSSYELLTLRLLRDDGAVVYMNGMEVLRTNMPNSTINFKTLASSPIFSTEGNFVKRTISPNFLKSGNNVIAVEIHQSSPSSSDISFDLELIGIQQST